MRRRGKGKALPNRKKAPKKVKNRLHYNSVNIIAESRRAEKVLFRTF